MTTKRVKPQPLSSTPLGSCCDFCRGIVELDPGKDCVCCHGTGIKIARTGYIITPEKSRAALAAAIASIERNVELTRQDAKPEHQEPACVMTKVSANTMKVKMGSAISAARKSTGRKRFLEKQRSKTMSETADVVLKEKTIQQKIQDGSYFGATDELSAVDYNADKLYMRSSSLKVFRDETPAHYKASLNEVVEATPAMLWGTAFHALMLEGEKKELFAIKPEGMNRRGVANQKLYDEFHVANKDKIILSADIFEEVKSVADAVRSRPDIQRALKTGFSEVSAFTVCPLTGVRIKARADRFIQSKNIILDLKTTEDASPEAFKRKIKDMGYLHAAAHYMHVFSEVTGEKMNAFVLIAIEKSAPFEVAFYELDAEDLARAHEENIQALRLYAECLATDVWPGYGNQKIKMNKWFWKGNE